MYYIEMRIKTVFKIKKNEIKETISKVNTKYVK